METAEVAIRVVEGRAADTLAAVGLEVAAWAAVGMVARLVGVTRAGAERTEDAKEATPVRGQTAVAMWEEVAQGEAMVAVVQAVASTRE